jgi:AraC family transcriptional regulator, exoenzyme S synthesis regulatory protein ExsA
MRIIFSFVSFFTQKSFPVLNYIQHVKSKPDYFKQFSCKELLCLMYDCPAEMPPKMGKYAEHNYLWYILTGKKILHANSRSWLVEGGSAVFVKKGACIYEQIFDDVFCVITFFVPDSYIRSFVQQNSSLINRTVDLGAVHQVMPVQVDPIMVAFYNSVIPYFSPGAKPNEDLLELKFRELLINIVMNDSNSELIHYFQSLGATPAANLQQIMEDNCLYNLQLEDYARLCCRSLSSFKRDFHAAYSVTPHRWLMQKRLTHARQLLRSTDKAVSDIAFECGFENNSHFSRLFKENYSISPLQYRKQQVDPILVLAS